MRAEVPSRPGLPQLGEVSETLDKCHTECVS
jgi:hypothetical protein